MSAGHLIRSNVKNALKLLQQGKGVLETLRKTQIEYGFSMTADDLRQHHKDEIEFLKTTRGPLSKLDEKLEQRLTYMKAVRLTRELE